MVNHNSYNLNKNKKCENLYKISFLSEHEIFFLSANVFTFLFQIITTSINFFVFFIRRRSSRQKSPSSIQARSSMALERLTKLLLSAPQSPPDDNDSFDDMLTEFQQKQVGISGGCVVWAVCKDHWI